MAVKLHETQERAARFTAWQGADAMLAAPSASFEADAPAIHCQKRKGAP
jgi:hypothetical protein